MSMDLNQLNTQIKNESMIVNRVMNEASKVIVGQREMLDFEPARGLHHRGAHRRAHAVGTLQQISRAASDDPGRWSRATSGAGPPSR